MQTASPRRMRILAIMNGSYQTESGLHQLFARHRARGEWFRRHDEIEYFIRAVRRYPDQNNILTLYNEGQRKRFEDKARRLKKNGNPKLSNYIKKISE